MKSRIIFVAFIFYNLSIAAQPDNQAEQSDGQRKPSPVTVIIHSKPHSSCNSDNRNKQESKDQSQPTTNTTTGVQQNTNQAPRSSGMSITDALNAYITLICWPAGGLIYWMRNNSNEE